MRTHVGLQTILEWAGKESGIDEDLKTCFEIGDAQKLSSIARYWVATDGDTLPRMETWQMMNPLPYEYPITQDVYGKLFASVGRNESGVQAYFRSRAQRVSSSGLNLALDTTTFSTYSKNQIEARQGFNKDGDGLDTIKLLVLYSVENREPVAFSKQPGNIPDKISLANSLRQLEVLGLSAPVIVADNGFYCQANMTYLAREHVKFLMLANSTDKWVREEIDAVREYKLPFRVGHHVASHIVTYARNNNLSPTNFPYEQVKKIYAEVIKSEYPQGNPVCPMSEQELRDTLNPTAIVANRKTEGGPQPAELTKALSAADAAIAEQREWTKQNRRHIDQSLAKLDADFQKLVEQK